MFFIVKDLPAFSVYYRYGGNEYDTLNRCGFEIMKIPVATGFNIDVKADYWNSYLNRLGFNTAVEFNVPVNGTVGIIISAGYKTGVLCRDYLQIKDSMGMAELK